MCQAMQASMILDQIFFVILETTDSEMKLQSLPRLLQYAGWELLHMSNSHPAWVF